MDAGSDQHKAAAFLASDRLASLSDTIFGVAMTLIATTLLPSVQTLKGSALDMLRDMRGELVTVAFSFAIAGSYWIVQQRRLAMTRSVTVRQTLLHLGFLFLIVLLPLSTGLWGRDGAIPPVVMIYGTHLVLIAVFNLLLWIDVHRSVAVRPQIVRSSAALSLLVAALAIGTVWPRIAQYVWCATLATSLLGPGPVMPDRAAQVARAVRRR